MLSHNAMTWRFLIFSANEMNVTPLYGGEGGGQILTAPASLIRDPSNIASQADLYPSGRGQSVPGR